MHKMFAVSLMALSLMGCAGMHDHKSAFVNGYQVYGPTQRNGYEGVIVVSWSNIGINEVNQRAINNCSNLGGIKSTPYLFEEAFGVRNYHYVCYGQNFSFGVSPTKNTFEQTSNINSYSSPQNSAESQDDATCQKYGFTPQTESYANCRLQLEMAKRQIQAQRNQYEAEVAAYERRKEEARRKRESDFLINMGTRMMGGQDMGSAAMNAAEVGSPPTPPQSYSQRIRLPNGQWVTCDQHGPTVYCF